MGNITRYRFDGVDGLIIGVGFFVGLFGGAANGLGLLSFAAAVALPAAAVGFRRVLRPDDPKLLYAKTPRPRASRVLRLLLFTFGAPLALAGLALTVLRATIPSSMESWGIAFGTLGAGIAGVCWGLVLQRRAERRAQQRRERKAERAQWP